MYCDIVIKLHDDQSEGLSRSSIARMVETAGGGKFSKEQCERTWDKTIFPYGKKVGLLTGYVKPQEGTSKRTAAGNRKLQQAWHETVDELLVKVKTRAKEVLEDDDLVHKMMPRLVFNLDEECLHALGKNTKIAGSKERKKHDNQHASSRYVLCGSKRC